MSFTFKIALYEYLYSNTIDLYRLVKQDSSCGSSMRFLSKKKNAKNAVFFFFSVLVVFYFFFFCSYQKSIKIQPTYRQIVVSFSNYSKTTENSENVFKQINIGRKIYTFRDTLTITLEYLSQKTKLSILIETNISKNIEQRNEFKLGVSGPSGHGRP